MLPKSTARSLPMVLLKAREVIMTHFRPMLARLDITEQQWRVMRVLIEDGPLDATEVAARASILAPSVTRIIKTLEERRLITRGKFVGDARRTLLAISQDGAALIKSASRERRRIYEDLVLRHGNRELEKLIDLLEALIQRELSADDSDEFEHLVETEESPA